MSVFFGGEIEKKGDMKDTYITDLRKLVEKLEVENSELRKKIGIYEGKKIWEVGVCGGFARIVAVQKRDKKAQKVPLLVKVK